MVANHHLENPKKIMISQKHLHRFQQNFSVLMHNGPLKFKCYKMYCNKTANINDKICSLSTVLTAIIKNCKNHRMVI